MSSSSEAATWSGAELEDDLLMKFMLTVLYDPFARRLSQQDLFILNGVKEDQCALFAFVDVYKLSKNHVTELQWDTPDTSIGIQNFFVLVSLVVLVCNKEIL